MIRSTIRTIVRAVRATVAPATLYTPTEQTPAATVVPDPAGMYEADELPELADIERAALSFSLAADNARRADRSKRAARRILDKLPAGLYGTWLVSRTPSSRQVVDLEAVTATYKRLGIGPVPMKACAPSLKVTRAAVPAEVSA